MASPARSKRSKSAADDETEAEAAGETNIQVERSNDSTENETSSESSDEEQAPTLAATRTRRANAGNRMEALTKDELQQDDAYKNIYGGFNELENDEEFGAKNESDENTDSGESSISYEQTSSEDEDESAQKMRVDDENDDGAKRRSRKKFSELVAASNAKRALTNRNLAGDAEKDHDPPPKRRRVVSMSSADSVPVQLNRRGRPPAAKNLDAGAKSSSFADIPAAAESSREMPAASSQFPSDNAKLKEILLETGDALRRSSRYATQQKSIETQERLFEERAARNARPKKVIRKDRPLTQEELMAQALEREKDSYRWLEERRQNVINKEKESKRVRRKVKFQEQCVKFMTRLKITETDQNKPNASDAAEHAAPSTTKANDSAAAGSSATQGAGSSNMQPHSSTGTTADSADRSKVMHTRRELLRNSRPTSSTLRPLTTSPVIEASFGLESQYVFPSKQAMDDYFAPLTGTKYPQPKRCPINGTIARYVDPLTKIPYSDKAALIAIRDAYVAHVMRKLPENDEHRVRLIEWYKQWRAAHTTAVGADPAAAAVNDTRQA